MQEDIDKLQKQLKNKLSDKRYNHTVGVRYTAEALAMRYGADLDRAAYAGVLHDCAKYCSGDKMIEKCRKHKINMTEVELKNPQLLHAKLGVYYAKHRYGVKDEEILSAIRWHTTGRPEMSLLEKIVFLADYIEPHRKPIPGLNEIRELAFCDLDRAVCRTMENTVSYLQKQNSSAANAKCYDPNTLLAYEYYKKHS
ncbi:MAG: bis(5'-nucleosyl)-tetraphosphatase (symmetrical) YqeK [Lachnospiraceae bacterium]|nr:bis(5'-nucleosyl)-tetraphosphatase (symmetrical) YqeK [Lachnospiraceae bacterium]